MKVTLINLQLLDGNNVVPPLGLLYIASSLEAAGHEVQCFDADPVYHERITEEIREFDPDLIGMGFLTLTYQRAKSLYGNLRKAFPEKVFCCGGVHPTVKPYETLSEFDFDFLVLGEGEHTMLEVCERLSDGGDLSGVAGIMYRKDGEIVNNGRREVIEDLDTLPFPARHKLDMGPYLKPPGIIRGYATENQTTIVTSRGCPFKCIYCGSHNIFGRRTRRRSAKNVVDEIAYLHRTYGIKGIYFCDDTFTLSKAWVKEYCQLLRERDLGVKWACQSRVDQTDEALLREMKESGLVQLDFGVESGSEKILKVLGKKAHVDAVRKSFKLCKKVGIRTLATFIIGNPEETREDIEETFRVAKEIDADYTAFYFLTPYPGTDIYDMAVENEWIDTSIPFSEAWSHRQPELPLMNINFSKEELMRMRRSMQNSFFVRNYLSRMPNYGFYSILFTIMFRNPMVIFHTLRKLIKTRRLDYLVEALNAEYWKIKKYKSA